MEYNSSEKIKIVNRISLVSIIWNIILSVVKVITGYFAKSHSILADGVHSLSDVLTTLIALVSVRMAAKEEDERHPYGHEKIEPIMSKLLAIVLIVTAFGMAWSSIKLLNSDSMKVPGIQALLVAMLSIAIKEWMYHYTNRAAIKIGSNALKADAWHHRSDALSSVGSFIGIGGALLGITIMDALAGIVISLVIIRVGIKIYVQSVKELLDTAAPKEVEEDIYVTIDKLDGVKGIDVLRTRMHGTRIFVDVEITVDGKKILWDAHEIAENVHHVIEKKFPEVKHCMVHVNPMCMGDMSYCNYSMSVNK